MGPGDHSHFDVLARLGGDLPGAVVVAPETGEVAAELGPFEWGRVRSLDVVQPKGAVKFSLAGVQMKFAAVREGERLTVPARGGDGLYILKVPAERYPGLPEAEFTAMSLCRAAGVRTAEFELVPVSRIDGVPAEFLVAGDHALLVRRFDRDANGGRIHMEDAAQILGAGGDRKYTMANSETVLNMIARFSAHGPEDALEGARRIAADVLVGNGDNHLKNWSFVFPDGRHARLSPAYDIVPTVSYNPGDNLALAFAGSSNPEEIGLHRFRRAAAFLKMSPELAEREVRRFVEACLDLWPAALTGLPFGEERSRALLARMERCRLAREARGLEQP